MYFVQNSETSSCRSEHSDNAHQSDDDLHYTRKRRGRGGDVVKLDEFQM